MSVEDWELVIETSDTSKAGVHYLDIVCNYVDYSGSGTREFRIDILDFCGTDTITINASILESTSLTYQAWDPDGDYTHLLDWDRVYSSASINFGCPEV